MGDLTCKGSYLFGTACGHCSRCAKELREMADKKEYQVKERLMAEQEVIKAIYDVCEEAIKKTWGNNLMSSIEKLDALQTSVISIMGIAGGALLYKKDEKK